MALTLSNPFPTGTTAPNFNLPDTVTGKIQPLFNLKGDKGTVVMFICNHCPFVIHVNNELVRLAKDYESKGIKLIAISSNNVADYPEDAPHFMKKVSKTVGYPFPYLYDESQEVAKKYKAACTPDFYIFDSELKSIYHGELDKSRPGNKIEVTGNSIRNALNNLLKDKSPLENQYPSIGCGIKWK